MLRMSDRSGLSLANDKWQILASVQVAPVAGSILASGQLGLLKSRRLAFLCSTKCPGEYVVQSDDFDGAMRDAVVTIIGGFQSPVER